MKFYAIQALAFFAGMWALTLNSACAQTAPQRYWVQFEGKSSDELPPGYTTPYSIANPAEFLSEKALRRRSLQSISVNHHDLPIPPTYLEALEEFEEIDVILKSKWFNAVTVKLLDTTFDINALLELPMVTEIKRVACWESDAGPQPAAPALRSHDVNDTSHYGKSWSALTQLHGEWLHGLGFRGAGMTIAVLDAGFENVESLPVFQRAWEEGRILEGMDAMQSQGGLFAHHRHGTSVLGTMAGALNDSLIGTAPDATYLLYRTEDAYSEYVIEEDYWIAAAEHADSSGVDLMNTSLGYSLFDDSTMNHTIADLDGVTTRISQAATWAAEKGILCVTSAGNSGSSPWHFITAPADAKGILTVGAVTEQGTHAAFSGWGPTADGRIKPDVMALGVQAAYPHYDSTIRRGNGTSFSSPILCGMAACLWQAFPEKSAAEIRLAIIQSAHLFTAPNDSMGHGIPDFKRAFELLAPQGAATMELSTGPLLIFPNPSADGVVRWQWHAEHSETSAPNRWVLYSLDGKQVDSGYAPLWSDEPGMYQGWAAPRVSAQSESLILQLLHDDMPLVSGKWMRMGN